MIWKSLMKNPVLGMGILMMFIFISLYGRKLAEKMGWASFQDRLNPTSCRAVMVKLKRTLPANQKAYCEEK